MERNYHLLMIGTVIISVLFVLPSALAANYTVGDNPGWATPTGGDPYATWASQHTFFVGDVLVFRFISGSHTVANVTKSAFDSCNTGNPLSIETNGPASFTIDKVGSHYFICTILNHCLLNQKLAISANSSNNTNPSNNPSSSPRSAPGGGPSPRSPPRKSGAGAPTMATRTFTLMFMFIGLVVYLN